MSSLLIEKVKAGIFLHLTIRHGHNTSTSMLLQSYQGCFTRAPPPHANEVPSQYNFIQACLFAVENVKIELFFTLENTVRSERISPYLQRKPSEL